MDLCDSCTHISCQGQETIWSVPTRIGKEPDSDVWRVAEESAGGALEGMVVEDKLLSLAMKDGTATIDGVRYEGLYLLKMFLKQVLAIPRQASGKEEIENLVITVPKLEVKLVDCLMYCADFLEIDRSRVHVISHAESFVYYVMSQKREVWSNQVGMFELSENGLHYYELRVQRGLRQMQVVADQEELEESFHLNVLDSDAGIHLCGTAAAEAPVFSDHPDRQGICTDGLGDRFYAADLQTAPGVCGDGCIYPRGADPLGRSL